MAKKCPRCGEGKLVKRVLTPNMDNEPDGETQVRIHEIYCSDGCGYSVQRDKTRSILSANLGRLQYARAYSVA